MCEPWPLTAMIAPPLVATPCINIFKMSGPAAAAHSSSSSSGVRVAMSSAECAHTKGGAGTAVCVRERARTRRDLLLRGERFTLNKHREVLQKLALALCAPPDVREEIVRDEITHVAAELAREAAVDERIVPAAHTHSAQLSVALEC